MLQSQQGQSQTELLLMRELMDFYREARSPSAHKLAMFEEQFLDCQHKIIKVVEFRKDLEKQIEVAGFQDQLKRELESVYHKLETYEGMVNQLMFKCKQKDNRNLFLNLQLLNLKGKSETRSKAEEQIQQLLILNENVNKLKCSCMSQGKQYQSNTSKNNGLEQLEQAKDFLRQKEALVEAKIKMMEKRAQIMENNQSYDKRYLSTMEESVKCYEEVFKKLVDKVKSPSFNLDKKKEQEYQNLCSENSLSYERAIIDLQHQVAALKEEAESSAQREKTVASEKDERIKELEDQLRQFQSRQNSETSSIEELKKDMLSRTELLNKQIISKDNKIADLTMTLQYQRLAGQESSRSEEDTNLLDQLNSRLNEEVMKCHSKINELQLRNKELGQITEKLTEQINKYQFENKQLKKESDEKEKQLCQLRRKEESHDKHLSAMRQKLESMLFKEGELLSQISELNIANQKHEKKLELFTVPLEQLRLEVERQVEAQWLTQRSEIDSMITVIHQLVKQTVQLPEPIEADSCD